MPPGEFQKMYEAEDSYFWFVSKRRLVSRLVSRVALPEKALLLDLGCGTGSTLRTLQGYGSVVGLDCFGEALRFCAQRSQRLLVLSSGERLPFRGGCFELVTSLDSIEHTLDPPSVIREVHRTLSPSGWFLVTAPAHPALFGAHDYALGHKVRYTKRSLLLLLRQGGFEAVMCGHFFGLVFPLAAALKIYQKWFGSRTETISYALPRSLNLILVAICSFEAWLFPFVRLPLGTTLVALCKKAR